MKLTRRQLFASSVLAPFVAKAAAKADKEAPVVLKLNMREPQNPITGDLYWNDIVGRCYVFDGEKWMEVLP